MNRIKIIIVLLAVISGICRAGACRTEPKAEQAKAAEPGPVDVVLAQLKQTTSKLKTYQCQIEHLVVQPDFETERLRKGVLLYAKTEKSSKLRVNFSTVKQDDDKQEKYVEHYIFNGDWVTSVDYKFEGVWLTDINHETKAVECHQFAEPTDANEQIDAFELVSRNFPLVGFAKPEELKREFDITLVDQLTEKGPYAHQLHLKVKPDSVYKQDYTSIDFWTDKKTGLPSKIVANTTEGDIYRITFLKVKVNKKLKKGAFNIKIPKGFGQPQINPMKKKATPPPGPENTNKTNLPPKPKNKM